MTAFLTTLMITFMIIIIVRDVLMTEYFTNLIILLYDYSFQSSFLRDRVL